MANLKVIQPFHEFFRQLLDNFYITEIVDWTPRAISSNAVPSWRAYSWLHKSHCLHLIKENDFLEICRQSVIWNYNVWIGLDYQFQTGWKILNIFYVRTGISNPSFPPHLVTLTSILKLWPLMIGFDKGRGRVLGYEQKLVSNSNSGQRLSPCHNIILKVSAATNICGEGSPGKRIWFGKNNTELFIPFFAAKLYSKITFVRMLLPNMFTELWKPQVIYVFSLKVEFSFSDHCIAQWWWMIFSRIVMLVCVHVAHRDNNHCNQYLLSLTMWYIVTCKLLPYTYTLIFQVQGQLSGFLSRYSSRRFLLYF